jgi:hypothetical protein
MAWLGRRPLGGLSRRRRRWRSGRRSQSATSAVRIIHIIKSVIFQNQSHQTVQDKILIIYFIHSSIIFLPFSSIYILYINTVLKSNFTVELIVPQKRFATPILHQQQQTTRTTCVPIDWQLPSWCSSTRTRCSRTAARLAGRTSRSCGSTFANGRSTSTGPSNTRASRGRKCAQLFDGDFCHNPIPNGHF